MNDRWSDKDAGRRLVAFATAVLNLRGIRSGTEEVR